MKISNILPKFPTNPSKMFFKFIFHLCTSLFIILIISGYITSNGTSTTSKTTAKITPKITINVTLNTTTNITLKTTPKVTPKTTTKVTPKTTTKATPKTTTKATPKTTTKATPKTTTKVTPKTTPKVTLKTTIKVTPKTTTKVTPKTTTKVTPKTTTKITPKTTTKIIPKTTIKTTPKTTTKITPKTTTKTTPKKTPAMKSKTRTTIPTTRNFTLWDTPTGCNLGFRMRDMGMIPHIVTYFPKHVLKVIYELKGVTLEIQHIDRGVYFNDSVLHDKPTDVEYQWDDFENYTLIFTFINVTNQSIEGPDKFINHTQYHHWLIYNIPGYNRKDGIEYFKYEGAPPMRKQEYRLYIFLLFKQKRNFYIADDQNQTISNLTRSSFTINEFIKKYDLESLHSANYLLQSVTNE